MSDKPPSPPRYGLYIPPAKAGKEPAKKSSRDRDYLQLQAPFLKAQLTEPNSPKSGPKYLPNLMERAAERKREAEERMEKRDKPGDNAPEVFVTASYANHLKNAKGKPGPRRAGDDKLIN